MDGGQALQNQHEGKRRQNQSKAGIISCASQRTRDGDEQGAKKAANRQIGPEGCRGKAVVPFASLNQRIRNAALNQCPAEFHKHGGIGNDAELLGREQPGQRHENDDGRKIVKDGCEDGPFSTYGQILLYKDSKVVVKGKSVSISVE